MKKYKVWVEVKELYTMIVDAEDETDALQIAENNFNSNIASFEDYGDCDAVDVELVEKDTEED